MRYSVALPGGTLGAVCLLIASPVWAIDGFQPSATTVGHAAFQLTIFGTGFVPGETFEVTRSGTTSIFDPLPAVFVDSSRYVANIPAGFFLGSGTARIREIDADGTVYSPRDFIVNARPRIGSGLADGFVGQPYAFTPRVENGTPPFQWTLVSGTLPSGLSMNPASGLISGTPAMVEFATVVLRVTDSASVTTPNTTLNLSIFQGVGVAEDRYGVVRDRTLNVGGKGVLQNDGLSPSEEQAALEQGPGHGVLTLDPGGSFRYTPNAGFEGEDTFRYRVRLQSGAMATGTARIIVAGAGTSSTCRLDPPSIHEYTMYRGTYTFPVLVVVTIAGDVPLAEAPVVTSAGLVNRTNSAGKTSFTLTVEADHSGTMSAGSEYPLPETGPAFECSAEVVVGVSPLHVLTNVCDYLFSQDPASPAARLAEDPLDLFRQFRDQVLARSGAGQDYAQQYYRFRPEFARILFQNPGLLWRIQQKVKQHRDLVQSLVSGRPGTFSRRDLAELTALAQELENRASPDLRKVLSRLRRDMFDPKLMAQHGIAIRDEPIQLRSADSPRDSFRNLPLRFEAGRGVGNYVARGPGYGVVLKPGEALLSLDQGTARVRMKLAGARGSPRASPEDPLSGVTNYFAGNDARNWRTNVRGFGRIRYAGVYPGIDLVYYGNQRQLEYDFVVAPGASPGKIALTFEGIERVTTTADGELVLHQSSGDLRLRRPVVYQEIGGQRNLVAGEYRILGRDRIGFRIGEYDQSWPLVIDPVLSYSSYLGGSDLEAAMAIAVDANGNVYVSGATRSADFFTMSPYRQRIGGGQFGADGFVTKLDATGTTVLYSTYFGGSDDDIGMGVAVDPQGNAYVTGVTRSRDFPTAQALQPAFGGAGPLLGSDAFVLKLNSSGSALVYSTYLGGSGDDGARGLAIDAAGSAYVAGGTSSTNFPRAAPLQSAHGGGGNLGGDAFVAKLNPAGTALVYSTYLGGSDDDTAAGIALDGAGSAYITGVTFSPDFPLANALQANRKGSSDAFAAKLNPAGSALAYSTLLGGSGSEYGMGIAVDAAGSAYLTGFTDSANDFPKQAPAQTAFGESNGVGVDAFVTKLNPNGAGLGYSTFLGGRGLDFGQAIRVDAAGNAYVGGETYSTDFASGAALLPVFGGQGDGFLAKLNAAGSAFEYRNHLGGSGADGVMGLAVDGAGNAYTAGISASLDGPATFAAHQTSLRGASDAWIVKLGSGSGPPLIASVSAASQAGITGLAPESIGTAYGSGLAGGSSVADSGPVTSLGGVSLAVRDAAGTERLARLYFVSPGQINYIVPAGTGEGLAALTVRRDGQVAATGTARIQRVAPALFTMNSTGQGVPAALALVVAPDGTRTTIPVFRCGSAAGGCVPEPIGLGSEGQQVYLLLFGTGIRGYGQSVAAAIGGVNVPVLGAVAQSEFEGLDQVNIGPLPRSLAGRGAVPLILTVDGRTANAVTVNIR